MNEQPRETRELPTPITLPPISLETATLEWIADPHADLSHIVFRQEAVRRARGALGWDVPRKCVAGHPVPIPITQEMMDLAYATYRETGTLSEVLRALVPLVAIEVRKIGANNL